VKGREMKESVGGKTVTLQYYRSVIGRPDRQRKVLAGLGFRKLNQVIRLQDTPEVRGMVAKIPHLVRILEGQA